MRDLHLRTAETLGDSDIILLLIARKILKKHPGSTQNFIDAAVSQMILDDERHRKAKKMK